MVTRGSPLAPTPLAGHDWQDMTDAQRLAALQVGWAQVAYLYTWRLTFVKADRQGRVIVRLEGVEGEAGRGSALMLAEMHLQAGIDPGVTLLMEPLGDANKLRLFRGVKPQ